jgi:hypothetical protein
LVIIPIACLCADCPIPAGEDFPLARLKVSYGRKIKELEYILKEAVVSPKVVSTGICLRDWVNPRLTSVTIDRSLNNDRTE